MRDPLCLADPSEPSTVLGGPRGFTVAAWVRRANYGPLRDTMFEFGDVISH